MTHIFERRTIAQALVLLVALLAARADAQDRRFQADPFRPLPSQQTSYFHVSGAQTLDVGRWEAGLVLHHAWKPLVVSGPGGRLGAPITHLTTLDLIAAVGVYEGFDVGVALPVFLYQDGEQLGVPEIDVPNPQPGVGDLRVVPRLRLWQSASEAWGLAVLVDAALPTGANRLDYQTEAWRAEPRVAFEYASGRWRVAANTGWFFRPKTTIANVDVDDTLTWGLAAAFELIEGRVFLVPEYASSASVLEPVDLEEVPMELRGGVKTFPAPGLLVEGGVGVGLVEGFGTPDVRLFAGLTYAPIRAREPTCARLYDDHPDVDDDALCELPIGDASGLLCDVCRPREGGYPAPGEIAAWAAADDAAGPIRYGYYSERGTDDRVDDDNDGIADGCDVCHPADACSPRLSTNDGLDADGDGIPDGCDACPDGLDLVDSDGDCVADCFDACPMRPETFNGLADDDGCPDGIEECICDASVMELPFTTSALDLFVALGGTAEEALLRAEEGVDLAQPIAPFFFGYDMWEGTVSNEAFDALVRMDLLLDQISATLAFSPCDFRVQIFGHTDADGASEYNRWLSLQRAEYVASLLRSAGVPEADIERVAEGEGARYFVDDPRDDYNPGNVLNRRAVMQLACEDVPADPPLIGAPVCEPPRAARCVSER